MENTLPTNEGIRCLQRALIPFAVDLQITRSKPGEYDSQGRWLSVHNFTIDLKANVQPMGPKELLRLPENWRSRGVLLVFTTEILNVGQAETGQEPDRFSWNEDRYEIQSVEDWSQFGFWKSIALKVNR